MLLSSYPTAVAHCGIPKSHMMLLQNSIMRPITAASINSASVDDIATIGSRFAFQPTAPPAIMIVPPPIDHRVNRHVAHSASM